MRSARSHRAEAGFEPARNVHVEVVVVGGGTAGNAVAGRLVEAGHGVTVLEAGPDHGAFAEGRWPPDLLDATTLPTSHDWGYRGTGADGRALAFDRARVIGGCSAHNGSTMSVGWRGDDIDLPAGWSADDLAQARYRAIAQTRVSVPDDSDLQPFQRAFLDGCASLGLRRSDDLLDPDGRSGVSVSPVNIVDGVRWNTSLAYLDPVRPRPELRIVDHCLVDRVETRQGSVVAVHGVVDDEAVVVHSNTIVLAAGAYGTPAILLRSGIGPAAHLRALDIPVVVDLPGVGSTLQDHPVLRCEFSASRALVEALATFAEANGFLPEEQSLAKVTSSLSHDIDGAPYDTHVFPWIEPDPDRIWRCVFPVGLLRPRSFGSVRLADRDPATPPLIDHRYLHHADDVTRLLDLLPWVDDLVNTPALAPLLGDALLVPPRGGIDELVAWARRHHHHYWHPTGGAALGRDGDPFAVCDHRAAVMGIEGLYVADASLLPRAPRATPALPVTTFGEHVAEVLIAALGGSTDSAIGGPR